jgi:hypothetical protein
MPVLLAAIFNRDLPRDVMLRYPQLYSVGQKREAFNVKHMVFVLLKAVVDSTILYWFSIYTFALAPTVEK